jgi:hypothetical protein
MSFLGEKRTLRSAPMDVSLHVEAGSPSLLTRLPSNASLVRRQRGQRNPSLLVIARIAEALDALRPVA